jgi:hypothetical protein
MSMKDQILQLLLAGKRPAGIILTLLEVMTDEQAIEAGKRLGITAPAPVEHVTPEDLAADYCDFDPCDPEDVPRLDFAAIIKVLSEPTKH